MLPETYYSLFDKSSTNDLTCAVSQAAHILNTYEIGPEMILWCSIPKLFNFIGLDFVVFQIIAFKMMSKFSGLSLYE